jgi:hypothetical protein
VRVEQSFVLPPGACPASSPSSPSFQLVLNLPVACAVNARQSLLQLLPLLRFCLLLLYRQYRHDTIYLLPLLPLPLPLLLLLLPLLLLHCCCYCSACAAAGCAAACA